MSRAGEYNFITVIFSSEEIAVSHSELVCHHDYKTFTELWTITRVWTTSAVSIAQRSCDLSRKKNRILVNFKVQVLSNVRNSCQTAVDFSSSAVVLDCSTSLGDLCSFCLHFDARHQILFVIALSFFLSDKPVDTPNGRKQHLRSRARCQCWWIYCRLPSFPYACKDSVSILLCNLAGAINTVDWDFDIQDCRPQIWSYRVEGQLYCAERVQSEFWLILIQMVWSTLVDMCLSLYIFGLSPQDLTLYFWVWQTHTVCLFRFFFGSSPLFKIEHPHNTSMDRSLLC